MVISKLVDPLKNSFAEGFCLMIKMLIVFMLRRMSHINQAVRSMGIVLSQKSSVGQIRFL